MKNIYKILSAAILSAGLWACAGDSGTVYTPGDDDRILLSSLPAATVEGDVTRAAAGFPNEGRIGVIAAYDEGGTIDWTSYSDIYNAPATATSVSGGVYSFTWDTPKYWPFNDRKLSFMAYSPVAGLTNSVLLSTTAPILLINLTEDMPDVMYAMGTSSPVAGPHWKSQRTNVDLGQFKHALSQLTVRVVPDNMSPSIKITSLIVSTSNQSATFDLTQGDGGLQLTNEENEYFACSLTDKIENIPFSNDLLLFPGTEEVTQVTISLYDEDFPTSTVTKSYMMPVFQNLTGDGSLTLERGVNTILQITVRSIDVIDTDITLLGKVSDWNYGEDFSVTIN